jgi:hypothetical protein
MGENRFPRDRSVLAMNLDSAVEVDFGKVIDV